MDRKRKIVIAAAAGLALAGGGVGVAQAVGGDEPDRSATGPDADRAKAAAIERLPGGIAQAVERDGEKGATWEVEVRKPDGSTVDVRLDAAFGRVSVDRDTESADDDE